VGHSTYTTIQMLERAPAWLRCCAQKMMMHALWLLGVCILPAAFGLAGNGVNLQPSYYNNGNVTFGWDLMHGYKQIKSVRIEIEPDKVKQGKGWIAEAVNNGYDVIATYHKCAVLGSDDPQELMYGAEWWVTNYKHLRESGDFTINIMNEWGSHEQTKDSFSSAYNSAISTIRSVYSGSLIVDIPGWGQEYDTAAAASPLMPDQRVTFSAHVYPQSWNAARNSCVQPSDIDTLVSTGRPCIVGEFGKVGTGGTDVNAVISRAKELGLPVLAWAWNGDGGEMNMVQPAWYTDATASSYKESSYFNSVIGML
jgi:mannan endo-1,4-beta-mannosidase